MGSKELRELILRWFQNERLLGTGWIEVEDLGNGPNLLRHSAGSGISSVPTGNSGSQVYRPDGSYLTSTKKSVALLGYSRLVMGCKKCALHKMRHKVVFGEGNPESGLVFIGEAPGRNEDNSGKPFVGEAGKLLTRLIKSIGLERDDVYITNIIKCRPPGNRDPLPEEIDKCRPWLDEQLNIMKPRILCCLGRHSTYALLGIQGPFSKIRGVVYKYKDIKVVPTYHPAALLYHPGWTTTVKEDLKLVKQLYDGK